MKKYRNVSSILKKSNIFYVFVSWNVLGFCFYRYMRPSKEDREKLNWKEMTSSQKYISMMSDPEEKLEVIKFKGFTKQDSDVKTSGDYVLPARPNPPPPESDPQ